MPGPASMEDVAKEFRAQGRDSILSRTAYQHRRFVLEKSHGSSLWQSRFTTVRKSYRGVEFDWITTPDESLWLPRQRQFLMTLDHNYMNPNSGFKRVLDVLAPLAHDRHLKLPALIVQLLVVISKFPDVEEKLVYLDHQRTYLDNRMKAKGAVRMTETLKYQAQLGPYRAALKVAIYPNLEPDLLFVEPEYTVYGCKTRAILEKFLEGELKTLPDLSSELAELPVSRIL
ncbi:hypothetical protein C8R45DRAFT_1099687 [Mycena sanguinolenta]|nr:hypothetical protein C8R45DRAFT_1099687 [Mycena sanguinolenta]